MAGQTVGFFGRVAGWPAATKAYIQELQLEMRRVTWPGWKQVRATTVVVIPLAWTAASRAVQPAMTAVPRVPEPFISVVNFTEADRFPVTEATESSEAR